MPCSLHAYLFVDQSGNLKRSEYDRHSCISIPNISLIKIRPQHQWSRAFILITSVLNHLVFTSTGNSDIREPSSSSTPVLSTFSYCTIVICSVQFYRSNRSENRKKMKCFLLLNKHFMNYKFAKAKSYKEKKWNFK